MLLLDFGLEVLDFVLYYLWVAETCLVDNIHPLFNDIGIGRIAHFKDGLLLDAKDAIVCIQVRYHEVEDVGAC